MALGAPKLSFSIWFSVFVKWVEKTDCLQKSICIKLPFTKKGLYIKTLVVQGNMLKQKKHLPSFVVYVNELIFKFQNKDSGNFFGWNSGVNKLVNEYQKENVFHFLALRKH